MIGQMIIIPSPIKLPLTTLGFIEPYNPEEFLPTLNLIANQLTFIGLAAFFLNRRRLCFCCLKELRNCCEKQGVKCYPIINDSKF